MSRIHPTFALVLLTISFAFVAHAQTEKTFPTDDEINLVLTQTDRAMQEYKPLIDQEEILIGKTAKDAVATDRKLVSTLETAVKAFRTKPQAFNGPLGFAFFEWLDDADRNALLCASGAASQSTLHMIAGDTGNANTLLNLSKSCMDVSSLIYTVSENAGSLYQRYVEAEEQLAAQSGEVAQKCVDILKKNGATPKR